MLLEIFRARRILPGTLLRILRIILADKYPARSFTLLIYIKLEEYRIKCFSAPKSSSIELKRR